MEVPVEVMLEAYQRYNEICRSHTTEWAVLYKEEAVIGKHGIDNLDLISVTAETD